MINIDNSSDLSSIFSQTLNQISSIVEKHNVIAKPFHRASLEKFNSLDLDNKKEALKYSSTFLDTLEQSSSSKWSHKDDLHFLWNSLKAMNLTPSSDFFDHIQNGDVIEIYNLQNVQIWRNLASMELCSYTLEEMYCHTWETRYLRNEETLLKIQTAFQEMFALNPPATYKCNIKNIITETFSEEQLVIDANHKSACLVFDKNSLPVGYLLVTSAKVLEKRGENQLPDNVISINQL